MKILLISQWYAPIKGAAAKRTGKMAQFLVKAGHIVTVLTGFPSYPTGILDPKYKQKLYVKEKIDHISVIRAYEYPVSTQDNSIKRIFNWVTFTKSASIASLCGKSYDAVIVSSPSFLSGIAGLIAARHKKTKFFFDVRDLWPDSAVELGLLKKNSLITKKLEKLERKFYKRATKIFTATPGIKAHLIKENIPENKIEVLLNSVDTNVFKPEKPDLTNLGYAPDDFICGYVGNHSRIYDLETVIKAAEILKKYEKIKFIFIGEGEDKEKIKKLAQNNPNIRFENEKSLNTLPAIINCFSLGLAPISNIGVSQESFPSKISEYLACAKPVLASLKGDMAKYLQNTDSGLIYNPGDSQGLAESILKLYNNHELAQKMGQNARTLAQTEFSDQTAQEIIIKNII